MSLYAGVSITDISPWEGLELGGYPHNPRHNTGIHDPLYASCILLDNGRKKLAIIAMDLLFYSKKHVQEIRQRIREKTGIPEKNIMVSCSHTHSGPWASGRLDAESLLTGVQQDNRYIELLNDKLVHLVETASGNLFEAEISVRKGLCGKLQGVGGNRRSPSGITDPEVCTIAVKEKGGAIKGIYLNYALHPTVIHAESTVVTADFPAYTRMKLAEALPGSVLLYAQGASGNQSTRYYRSGQTFEEAKRIGEAVANAAADTINRMEFTAEIQLDAISEELKIELRKLPSLEEMQERRSLLENKYKALLEMNAPYIDVQNANLKLLGAEGLLGFVKMMDMQGKIELLADEDPAEIQILQIGEATIVALPGEWFVEFALDIKDRSPFPNTFVTTLANGCLPGYVYTKESLVEGGYETDTSLIHEDYGEKLVDQVISLLRNFQQAEGG